MQFTVVRSTWHERLSIKGYSPKMFGAEPARQEAINLISTVKEAIFQIVGGLSEEEAEELLDYLNMRADPDTLSQEEMARVHAGRKEIARGEYVTLEELHRRLDL